MLDEHQNAVEEPEDRIDLDTDIDPTGEEPGDGTDHASKSTKIETPEDIANSRKYHQDRVQAQAEQLKEQEAIIAELEAEAANLSVSSPPRLTNASAPVALGPQSTVFEDQEDDSGYVTEQSLDKRMAKLEDNLANRIFQTQEEKNRAEYIHAVRTAWVKNDAHAKHVVFGFAEKNKIPQDVVDKAIQYAGETATLYGSLEEGIYDANAPLKHQKLIVDQLKNHLAFAAAGQIRQEQQEKGDEQVTAAGQLAQPSSTGSSPAPSKNWNDQEADDIAPDDDDLPG